MFRVVVGSYQHVLYGFDVTNASSVVPTLEKKDKEDQDQDQDQDHEEEQEQNKSESTNEEEEQSTADPSAIRLKPAFSCSQLHTGAIKTVAIQASGTHLVSGSTDETIKILDLKRNVEVGSLLEHEGAVTGLSFYSTTHMISSGEDGKICVWKTKEWELIWTLKAHKGGVNGFSIHPSGRVIISVGKDSHLRLWNMVTGKSAFDKKLPFVPSGVVWSPSGNHYAIIHSYHVLIYTQEGDEQYDLTSEGDKELLAWGFITDTLFAAGGENKLVQVWDITTGAVVHLLAGHSNRIRGVSAAPISPEGGELPYLVSSDTDGTIVVWDLNVEKKFVCHFELPARVISLATAVLPARKAITKAKKKKKIAKVAGKAVQSKRKRKKIE